MSGPADSGHAGLVQRMVVDLGAAFHLRAAYAPTHPQVKTALARVCGAVAALRAHTGSAEVSLLLVEGQFLVDRQAIPEDANWVRGLRRAFDRNGIQGITLHAGLVEAELGAFLDACQGASGPVSSPHVQVGRAGFAATDAPEVAGERGPGPGARPEGGAALIVTPEQTAGACEELRAVGAGNATRVERLRSLLARLVRSVQAGALDSLRTALAHVDDREFLHGLAVALSTARLARALGIEGSELEDLALAGFLHDVGHLEEARSGEGRDASRSRHPIRGAARLAGLDGIPDVAVLAALDHHLRFDGTASHPGTSGPRRPGAAARVVAVADTWETVRALDGIRPSEAIAILRSRAGTFLDPVLVELLAGRVEPVPARPR